MSGGPELAPAPTPQPPGSDGWLSDAIRRTYAQIFPSNGNAIESEYSPLDAVSVGAGAAASSGIGQLKQGFQRGAAALAERGGLTDEAARMRALADQTRIQNAEDARLYQPMRAAYPYATAGGEAIPAAIPGGAVALKGQLGFNMGREYLSEVAMATKNQSLQRLVEALRRF